MAITKKTPKDIIGGIGSAEIGIGLGTISGSANYKYKYNDYREKSFE